VRASITVGSLRGRNSPRRLKAARKESDFYHGDSKHRATLRLWVDLFAVFRPRSATSREAVRGRSYGIPTSRKFGEKWGTLGQR